MGGMSWGAPPPLPNATHPYHWVCVCVGGLQQHARTAAAGLELTMTNLSANWLSQSSRGALHGSTQLSPAVTLP